MDCGCQLVGRHEQVDVADHAGGRIAVQTSDQMGDTLEQHRFDADSVKRAEDFAQLIGDPPVAVTVEFVDCLQIASDVGGQIGQQALVGEALVQPRRDEMAARQLDDAFPGDRAPADVVTQQPERPILAAQRAQGARNEQQAIVVVGHRMAGMPTKEVRRVAGPYPKCDRIQVDRSERPQDAEPLKTHRARIMTGVKPQAVAQSTARRWLARLGMSRRDLVLVGSLSGLAILAWCLPERYWDRLCRGLVRIQPWRNRGERLVRFGYAAALAGRRPGPTADACARAHLANVYRERLHLLACHRPAGQPTRPRLDGRAHLEAAIGEGKGVILWVGPFLFSDLLTKVALHDAGFAVSHLSRFSHGFSGSRVGERLLNPIRTSVERRYLAERPVIGREGSVAALRELSRRLRANRVVSMSAIGMANQLYRVPFMNGSVQMARGAPSLAIQTGAPLLPVFTGREPDGDWLTVIEPPLVRRDAWTRDEAVKRLLLQYAALLEYYVTRWPDQFRPAHLDFQPG